MHVCTKKGPEINHFLGYLWAFISENAIQNLTGGDKRLKRSEECSFERQQRERSLRPHQF